ncbi:MAG: D-alanyl-D-alanine carboxypeptidase family protein [Bacillota bacterium]
MTKLLRVVIFAATILASCQLAVHASPPVTAFSYVLLEADNFEVLANHNSNEKRPPASTTKILTGILALDLADIEEQVRISSKSASVGDASIYLRSGEIFYLFDLLKGALINSGNDAAYAIAEQVAGDEKLFVDLMNRKARILGAVDSFFTNPHGLPAEQHVSTAYDLALITNYSLQNSLFSEIVTTKNELIAPLNGKRKISLSNTNKLLWKSSEIKGVKTGTTNLAGKCLVSAAEKNGRLIIAVVLKSSDRFGDSERLLNWGFTEFALYGIDKGKYLEIIEIPNGHPNLVTVSPANDYVLTVSNKGVLETTVEWLEDCLPPLNKGVILGYLVIRQNGQVLKRLPMITGEKIVLKNSPGLSFKNFFQNKN